MLVGCVYIPSFPAFALTYQAGKPSPVAVVSSGRVIAASTSARKAGIEAGMQAERAACLLPDLRLAPRDLAVEQAVWDDVLHRIHALTPFLESYEPGMANVRAFEIGELQAFVARYRIRGGVGPCRSYSLLAAVRAVECGTFIVDSKRVRNFLEQFPTSKLSDLHYSRSLIEDLRLFGLSNLHAIYTRLSRKHLRDRFGAEGDRLHTLLHPAKEPDIPLHKPSPVITASWDFEVTASEPAELLPVLEYLSKEAAGGLGPYLCQRVRVVLQLRKEQRRRFATRITPEAVGESRRIFQTAKTLLVQILGADLEIEGMTLELGALRPPRYQQQALFRSRPSIYAAVRQINLRFPGSMLRAVSTPHILFEEDHDEYEPFPEELPVVHTRRRRGHR